MFYSRLEVVNGSSNRTVVSTNHNDTIIILLTTMQVVLLPTAIVLNIVALIAYRKVQRKPTVYFLRNIAVVDLIVPVYWFIRFALANTLCNLVFHILLLIHGASVAVTSIVILITDQLLTIVYPLRYPIFMSKSKSISLIISAWLLPAVSTFGVAFIIQYIVYVEEYPQLVKQYQKNVTFCSAVINEYIYNVPLLGLALLTSVSIVAILLMYLKIYSIARRSNSSLSADAQTYSKNKKALVTTLIILGNLVVFWCPPSVMFALISNKAISSSSWHSIVVRLSIMWTFLNLITDPIIICLRMKDVKAQYQRICCKCICIKRQNAVDMWSQ